MTKRKPLEWYSATAEGVGIDGKLPGCVKCCDMLLSPGFVEAVYSVSIEHSDSSPADLARRTIDNYHAGRHESV